MRLSPSFSAPIRQGEKHKITASTIEGLERAKGKMADCVAQLRSMGLGSMLDDQTLLSVLEQNNNDMDQTIDALFALGIGDEEEGGAAHVRAPSPRMAYAPPPKPPPSSQGVGNDDVDMDEMMKLLLGVDLNELEPKPKPAVQHAPSRQPEPPAMPARQPAQGGFQDVARKEKKAAKPLGGPALRDVRLVVFVGPPGCGKSTAALHFRTAGWEIVCQDEVGNRQECEALVHQHLKSGRRVVVDRTNIDEQQRSTWIRIAQYVSDKFVSVRVHVCMYACMYPCIRVSNIDEQQRSTWIRIAQYVSNEYISMHACKYVCIQH